MMSKLTLIILAVLLSWTTAAFAASLDGRQGDDSGPVDGSLITLIVNLDVNWNTRITKEELENNTLLPLSPNASSSFIRFADSNGTGDLSYEELGNGFNLLREVFPVSEGARLLVFMIYDTDNDGYITETELKEVSDIVGPPRPGNMSSVFNNFDSNDNRRIDYQEFAESLPLAEDLGDEARLFIENNDANNNVMISKEELKNNTILQLRFCEVNSFVDFVDTSGDGSIDANELDIGFSKLQQSPFVSPEASLLVFNIYDTDDDRVVSEAEWDAAVRIIGPPAQGNISSMFCDFDINNDGGIEYTEFASNLPRAIEQ